ncbi:hypothetical protein KXV85_005643, partial [Aspergillus fumigatus]
RHFARQDAGGGRCAGDAAGRLLHHHHHAGQGHLAPHGVSGVHLRRRVRHEGDGRRGRRADGRRPLDVPRAAVGADHGLAAVRSAFQRRPSGAIRDAQSLSRRDRKAGAARLRFRRRARGRIPSLQAGRREDGAGGCGPARPAAF